MTAKVLAIDIECSPGVADVWSLRDLHVGLNQLRKDPEIIGVGYSFDQAPSKYVSTWDQSELGGRAFMLGYIWELLDQADVVVSYNGVGFDIPWLNGEFMREGMTPPSPFKNVDLYRVFKRNARFISHKLDYVAGALLGQQKHPTGGHQLWVDCMEGDEKARKKMAAYCRQDVALLWPLLEIAKPWLGNTVNFALLNGVEELACSKCGSAAYLRPKGTAYTATLAYPQHLCDPKRGGCGAWIRDKRAVGSSRGVGVPR
jgi:hypothetical protein